MRLLTYQGIKWTIETLNVKCASKRIKLKNVLNV